jgi:hypothetical protein
MIKNAKRGLTQYARKCKKVPDPLVKNLDFEHVTCQIPGILKTEMSDG